MRREGHSDRCGVARHAGPSRSVLVLTLLASLLFLVAENAILLFVLGPTMHWPAALVGVGVALRVARTLLSALAPWLILALSAVSAGAVAMWAALRVGREVRHA
jgi:hypothetical protein